MIKTSNKPWSLLLLYILSVNVSSIIFRLFLFLILVFPCVSQVFSELRVLFSIGGRQFPLDSAVNYFYMPDHFLDNARNVSINLGFKMVIRHLITQTDIAYVLKL